MNNEFDRILRDRGLGDVADAYLTREEFINRLLCVGFTKADAESEWEVMEETR